ncbi:hypothetical protein Bca4012_013418 [Brassica carinata]
MLKRRTDAGGIRHEPAQFIRMLDFYALMSLWHRMWGTRAFSRLLGLGYNTFVVYNAKNTSKEHMDFLSTGYSCSDDVFFSKI